MNIDEINREILTLEKGQTTFANCEKLSQLYIVRDHIEGAGGVIQREATPRLSGSEFLEIASEVDILDLLEVLDEHMDTLQLVYPKDYQAIIKKISALK